MKYLLATDGDIYRPAQQAPFSDTGTDIESATLATYSWAMDNLRSANWTYTILTAQEFAQYQMEEGSRLHRQQLLTSGDDMPTASVPYARC